MSTVNTSGLAFSGLATGIDSDRIIAGLTKLNQARIDTLKARQSDIISQRTTFVELQARLFDLQTKTSALARSAGSAFDGRRAESSDSKIVAVAAGTSAVPGSYDLTVLSQARAHQVASAGFADPNAQIQEGTLTLRVGSGQTASITIDAKNNTLQGLVDAINASGSDVRASIINDGSTTPFRLTLTATRTGASNSITIENHLSEGSGQAIDLVATTLQSAQDAQIRLGSGPGAITLSNATNQVNNLIPGVSLNLLQAEPTRTITVTVSQNTEGIVSAVKDFADTYNALQDFLLERTSFDKDAGRGGILLGNRDTNRLMDELTAAISASVPGLSSSNNRLSTAGLTFDEKGKLQFDPGRLNQALSGPASGTADLKRLFGLTGTTNSNGVQFVFGSEKTIPTGAGTYQVQVTAPATRGIATASNPITTPVTLSSSNNVLNLRINGVAVNGITLDPGTYSVEALTEMVQQRMNASPGMNGSLVAVSLDNSGRLQIASKQFGSSSIVSFEPGSTALSSLGFSGLESGTGTDVAGNFLVNGQIEEANGSGQSLTGKNGNAHTSGLQVRATTNEPTTADVSITQGLASRLNAVISRYLDPANGRIRSIDETFQQNVDQLQESINRQQAMMEAKSAQLQLQFTAMESTINRLKGLQGQLSSLVTTLNTKR